MNFQKGDRVLVPGKVTADIDDDLVEVTTDLTHQTKHVQHDPGLLVADLLEELELCHRTMEPLGDDNLADHMRRNELRAAREAAQTPNVDDFFEPMKYTKDELIDIMEACGKALKAWPHK